MPIKVIALDVDGTLMSSRNELLPSTVEALQEAADRGIHIVLSTGRMLSECRELLEQLPMIRYAVTCTGAQTIDLRDGSTIGRKSLTADDLRLLCSHLWDLDVLLQVFDDHDGLMLRALQKPFAATTRRRTICAPMWKPTKAPPTNCICILPRRRTNKPPWSEQTVYPMILPTPAPPIWRSCPWVWTRDWGCGS